MKKFVYDNATVYITVPNDQQLENIRKSTERFVKKLAKEGLLQNEGRRNNRRTSIGDTNAGRRNKKVK